MSYAARVFRILIASPSDVVEEREVAVRVIQEWNDLQSAEREIVLLPLRWETHSAPEFGTRPQDALNRQIVDSCDLLIGIFWTRVGSPTGMADSGTLEEIDRVASQGKPIMLYFSQVKQDPEQIDLDQITKLREFKKRTYPKALIESFKSQVEFRDKLARQIEIQLRMLLAQEGESPETRGAPTKLGADIQLLFADPKTGEPCELILNLQTKLMVVKDFENLPDYTGKKAAAEGIAPPSAGTTSPFSVSLFTDIVNKDYYRQVTTYYAQHFLLSPLRFWLKNAGSIGARDVYINVALMSDMDIILVPKDRVGTAFPAMIISPALYGYGAPPMSSPSDLLALVGKTARTHIEIPALQPQRELSPVPEVLFGAPDSCKAVLHATVYADTLSEPLRHKLEVNLVVERIEFTAAQMVESIDKRGAS